MRNILYICTKNQYNWDSFIPQHMSAPTEIDISVLLLQDGKSLHNIPTPQISTLKTEGEEKDKSCTNEVITYQEFLEKIFLADLALVI